MALVLNNITIESRESDSFVNATQLCKAGGKEFKHWYSLDSTKELIKELKANLISHVGIPTCEKLVDISKSKYKGSWVHPDLAVQLAQWISPKFAIQVSRWIRELFITGSVSVDSKKTDDDLKELQSQLNALKEENKEKDDQLNRLHNIQRELLSYKKRVTKNETVYIVSTSEYARQGIFKIGRTKTSMKLRSSAHNNTHISGDKVKVIREFQVNDAVLVEKNIHTKLSGLLIEGDKEFFICPYDLLESLVDLIVHNDDNENQMVNKIIETVYKLKQKAFNSIDWMQGIPENLFKETVTITIADEKVAELDISLWDDNHKKEFIASCLDSYVQQQNKIDEEYTLIWKTFQLFLFSSLSIPKSKFKVSEWKAIVKDEVDKKEKLSIKWRS